MGLNIQQNSRTGYPGLYMNEATIISVTDISGTVPEHWTDAVDIGLEIEYDTGYGPRSNGSYPTLRIAGKLKRNEATNEVTGVGAGFRVTNIFAAMGHNDLPFAAGSDGSEDKTRIAIPKAWLEELKGKKFFKLSYIAGVRKDDPTKFQYRDVPQVVIAKNGKSRDEAQAVANSWYAYWKKSASPKDYTPELVNAPVVESATKNGDDTPF